MEDKKRNLAIYDWSGTLSDDFNAVLNTLNAVLSEYGAGPVDGDYLRSNYEKDPLDYYKKLCVTDSRENIDSKFRKHFKLQQPSVIYGAKETLKTIMDFGLELAVVSTLHQKFLEEEIGEYGFSEYFFQENVFGGIIEKAEVIELLKQRRDETYMVGDTWVDMEAAKIAGVTGIGVLGGYNSRELLEPYTGNIIENISELPDLILKHKL